jgi:peptidoglycan/xylan/chitin deacetylase (PgdA/CDA1 family)
VSEAAYSPDRSLKGKLRRRLVRLTARRPVRARLQRPMVSFTFDDAPVSAVEHGAALLERRGWRGTFYISAGLAGADGPMGSYAARQHWRGLAEAGHEIGCHTFSHRDLGQASADQTQDELRRNQSALEACGLPAPSTFAYPYGDVAGPAKRVLGRRYDLNRALHPGLVERGSDLNQAPAVAVEGPGGEARGAAWLRRAKARGAWLILCTHDVRPDASGWGVTPAALDRLMQQAEREGFEVVTVAEGARRLGACR